MADYTRILIKHDGRICQLANVACSTNDGSVELILRRDAENTSEFVWTSSDTTPRAVVFDSPRKSNQHVTIHASGTVNFGERSDGHSIYLEPLLNCTRLEFLLAYRIPSFSKLTELRKRQHPNDAVIDLSELPNEDSTFHFFVGPDNSPQVAGLHGLKLGFFERYALFLYRAEKSLGVLPALSSHFVTLKRTSGLFAAKQIKEQEAYRQFQEFVHQAPHGQIILSPPNAKGVWTAIFSVEKRIPPRLELEFNREGLFWKVEDQSLDNRLNRMRIRFSIRRSADNAIIRDPAAIKSIALHAELLS